MPGSKREFTSSCLCWIHTSGLVWSLCKCAALWRPVHGASATKRPCGTICEEKGNADRCEDTSPLNNTKCPSFFWGGGGGGGVFNTLYMRWNKKMKHVTTNSEILITNMF